MNTYYKNKLLWILSLSVLNVVPLHGILNRPSDIYEFDQLVDSTKLAVVYIRPEVGQDQGALFRKVSESDTYKQARDARVDGKRGLLFIITNQQDIPELKERYNLPNQGAILLFKDGVIYTIDGQTVGMIGDFTSTTVRGFIENYFGEFIEDTLSAQPVETTTTRIIERPVTRYVYVNEDPYYYRRPYYRSYPGFYLGGIFAPWLWSGRRFRRPFRRPFVGRPYVRPRGVIGRRPFVARPFVRPIGSIRRGPGVGRAPIARGAIMRGPVVRPMRGGAVFRGGGARFGSGGFRTGRGSFGRGGFSGARAGGFGGGRGGFGGGRGRR